MLGILFPPLLSFINYLTHTHTMYTCTPCTHVHHVHIMYTIIMFLLGAGGGGGAIRRKRMVCACHRLGLLLMARTNHTLPTDFSTPTEIHCKIFDRFRLLCFSGKVSKLFLCVCVDRPLKCLTSHLNGQLCVYEYA